MARDLNQVFLIGRLVKDPEIRYTATGTAVAKFSIANNVPFVQNKERKEYVNYFDINVWGNQAIVCEKYLKKGKQVAITGVLKQNRWNDKATGQTRSKIEITATAIQFLTPATTTQGLPPVSHESEVSSGQANFSDTSQVDDPWSDNWIDESNPFEGSSSDDDIPF